MTNSAFNSDSHNSLMMESVEEHYCSNYASYLDQEGKNRGYEWLLFDRDINTEVKN